MKKLLIPALALLFAGCGTNPGCNPTNCRESVVSELKTVEVFPLPHLNYRFIVRTQNGAVLYVETMGRGTNITARTTIFPPTEP